jgi:hypothetical protein
MTSPTERREQRAAATARRMANPPPPLPQPFPRPQPIASGSNDPFVVPPLPVPPAAQPRRANAPPNPAISVPTGVQGVALLRQQAEAAQAQLQAGGYRRRVAPAPVPVPAPVLPVPPLGVQGVALLRQQAQAAQAQLQPPRQRQHIPPVPIVLPHALPVLPAPHPPVQPVPAVPPIQPALPIPPPIPLPIPPPVRPAPPARMPPPQHNRPLPLARRSIVDDANIQPHNMGTMTVPCRKCQALHWMDERNVDSSLRNPEFGRCCIHGKVSLPLLPELPSPLRELFAGTDHRHQSFLNNIRKYNSALAFVSLGVNRDLSIQGHGPWVYKIHGELYHEHGSLLPEGNNPPVYAQLYILDNSAEALRHRLQRNDIADDNSLMHDLQDMMQQHNPFVHMYRQAAQRIRDVPNNMRNRVRAKITYREHTDPRRYNMPVTDEVAIILPDVQLDPDRPDQYRDIVVQLQGGAFRRISEMSSAYMPLHYVLYFPRGELGWHPRIERIQTEQPQNEEERQQRYQGYRSERPRQFVSLIEYAAFRLHPRVNEALTIFQGRKLFQQFVVDIWAAAEQERLRYIMREQNKLRADSYQGLADAFANLDGGDNLASQNIGTRVILPATFTGSTRNMLHALQNSLAIVRRFGTQDLFITMTANPNWPEIQTALLPGQTAADRPDLVARVFKQKKNDLINQIYKEGVFGKAVARVYAIEFQKRGLPHVHLLVWLDQDSKMRTPDDIDSVISAEMPNPDTHPVLYELIKSLMVHGPCGPDYPNSPCMRDGRCSKNFPKPLQETTILPANSYPLYRRRDDGRIHIKIVNGREWHFNNGWVIPSNHWGILKYRCHVNVEMTVNIHSVKYINKYIYKGGDRTTMEIQVDEVRQYLNSRYISAPEGMWRILQNELHSQVPAVLALPVHLENQHNITYDPNLDAETLRQQTENATTMLLEFFKMNNDDTWGAEARRHLYVEFPEHFVWRRKTWHIRRSGDTIGRVHFAGVNTGERFYLRMLLFIVRGPKSFQDLRIYEGQVYPTFKAACQARGLLEDDNEWRLCLQEASRIQSGAQLRRLFVTILLYCSPTSSVTLWMEFKEWICDDLAYRLRQFHNIQDPSQEQIDDYGLYLIDVLLRLSGKSLQEHYEEMPAIQNQWNEIETNRYLREQRIYDRDVERRKAEENIPRLNREQRQAFDTIRAAAMGTATNRKLFFLNGPGGTGKSFTWATLAHSLRAEGKIVLCVASSGIASLLLPGGRTAHSTFAIPIPIHETSVCRIRSNSDHARLLQETSLIIWDEAPMQHRHVMEAVDRSLRDIRRCEGEPFGGLPVAWGGDFQQTLPVVPHGKKEDIVAACIQKSYLWQHVHVMHLTHNMRVEQNAPESVQFARWLLDVGSGKDLPIDHKLNIPLHMLTGRDLDQLINQVYPDIEHGNTFPSQYFLDRAILAARNDEVFQINSKVLEKFPGQLRTFHSVDKVIQTPDNADLVQHYPLEFLNSIEMGSLPPSHLQVKKGVPLMLLRNLDPSEGLCNGTRLLLLSASNRLLHVKILTGPGANNRAFIPRIGLNTNDEELPFTLCRRQFPVRLAFGMTINKSQGQSLQTVGINLLTPVFSHGQFYVAVSRATNWRRVFILLGEGTQGKTENIVYPDVLLTP